MIQIESAKSQARPAARSVARRPQEAPLRRGRDRGNPYEIALKDLSIPRQALLSSREEQVLAGKIQSGLRRLEKVLRQTEGGCRMLLGYMTEVHSCPSMQKAWFAVRERLPEDLREATETFNRAESLAERWPERAEAAFLVGVGVLNRYRLDRETLFKWARKVARAQGAQAGLGILPRALKARRILERTVRIMEAARDKLILPNLRLLLKEVLRYRPNGMERSDLFQEGILGLHRAVFLFDPLRLTRFSTYATYWIQQAIRKALRDRSRLIRVPQGVQEELRNPDTRLSGDEVQRLHKIMRETVSLSAPDEVLGDGLRPAAGPPGSASQDEKFHCEAVPLALSRAMDCLSIREQRVICRRFGLVGGHVQTLNEIGFSLNLSRERIRQIETQALEKMSRSEILQDIYDQLEDGGPRCVRQPRPVRFPGWPSASPALRFAAQGLLQGKSP